MKKKSPSSWSRASHHSRIAVACSGVKGRTFATFCFDAICAFRPRFPTRAAVTWVRGNKPVVNRRRKNRGEDRAHQPNGRGAELTLARRILNRALGRKERPDRSRVDVNDTLRTERRQNVSAEGAAVTSQPAGASALFLESASACILKVTSRLPGLRPAPRFAIISARASSAFSLVENCGRAGDAPYLRPSTCQTVEPASVLIFRIGFAIFRFSLGRQYIGSFGVGMAAIWQRYLYLVDNTTFLEACRYQHLKSDHRG